jgi:hypothetical protein
MSAEDISLNRYFNYKKIRYMVYDKIVVDKEIAAVDGDGGRGQCVAAVLHKLVCESGKRTSASATAAAGAASGECRI